MTLKIITPPTVEPITLDQVKSHLRLTHDQDDALLTLMITSARERVESFLSQGLIKQRVLFSSPLSRLKRGGFGPIRMRAEQISFRIPWGPLMALESITLVGTKKRGNIPLDRIKVEQTFGWISFSWWTFMSQTLEVVYQAGYGETPDDIPAVFKEAILELVSAKYERRTSSDTQNQVLYDLLNPYRIKEI